jgi:two-component system phosphate regulon sensor histidine kinase PhoR
MAASEGDGEAADVAIAGRPRWVRRIARRRVVLLVTALVVLSFAIAPSVHWAHGLAGFLALATAILATPAEPRIDVEPFPRLRRRGSRDVRAPALAGALPDPCIVVNRRGVVVLLNDSAAATLPGLRIGDPLSFVLRAPEVTTALGTVMSGGQSISVVYQEKVPIERWIEAHVAPIRPDPDADADPEHVAITLHDRTDQERVERMRVDFVANASHELRTPLASLSGFIETLQGPARNDGAARERFLAIMRDQAVRMSRLIDDLLSLSRIELSVHVRPQDVVDLRPVLAQSVDALGPLARDTGVELVVEADRPSHRVIGSRDEVYRVCENLIENAIKYGEGGERIVIGLRHEAASEGFPDAVVLSVRDFGPGIAEEHIPRLTERFYRVDTAVSRQKGGTGLGLAIVKHIVMRHRGRLTIESELGEGTVFTVRLPAAGEQAPVARAPTASRSDN